MRLAENPEMLFLIKKKLFFAVRLDRNTQQFTDLIKR